MNYRQQLEVIKGLSIPPDTQTRMDCPFCNGRNTLSIDTTENKLGWYCFHASCNAKGKQEGKRICSTLKEYFMEINHYT